jgi:hypothetical protein
MPITSFWQKQSKWYSIATCARRNWRIRCSFERTEMVGNFENSLLIFPVLRELTFSTTGRSSIASSKLRFVLTKGGAGLRFARRHDRIFSTNIMTKPLLPAFLLICAALCAIPASAQAVAQEWPTRPVKLYVPIPGSPLCGAPE